MRALALVLVLLASSTMALTGGGSERSGPAAGSHPPVVSHGSSYKSDLENFSLTAKFLTTLQISGGQKDGGIEEAEDNPYDNTDNTLESIWVWTRYESLTGDKQYRPNSWKSWNYSIAYPAWQESDSGKIYSSGWAVLAWAEYKKVVGANAQYENYAQQAAQFIATNNGMEPDASWGANEKNLIRGWGAGALYTYSKETGDNAARVAALKIGNDTKAALNSNPNMAKTEAWALSGGAMVYGVASSSLLEFPDNAWLQGMVARMDTYVPVSGSGAGKSQNGWEAWYALGFDASWRILKDEYSWYNARNITNNLILRDVEKDGGIPTNIGDPTNTDESWVTNYRAYFALRPMLDNAQNATLKGIVKAASSGAPIPGATVTATDNVSSIAASGTTDAAGAYSLTLPPQIYKVKASAAGYDPSGTIQLTLPPASSKTQDFSLTGGGGGNDTAPPTITHTPVATADEGVAVTIGAQVVDNVGVASVNLDWRKQGAGSWQVQPMAKGSGNGYSGTIPAASVVPPAIEYYLEATDTSGNKATHPANGPTGPHVVTVRPRGGNDTKPPVIAHAPVTDADEGSDIKLWMNVSDDRLAHQVRVAPIDVGVSYRKSGDPSWQTGKAAAGASNEFVFTIPGTMVVRPAVEYFVEATDAAGNKATSPVTGASAPYKVNVHANSKPPPGVFGTKPSAGATDVPLDQVIEVSFTHEMDLASLKQALSISPIVKGMASGGDPVLIFRPDVPLAAGTKYTVTVSTAAKDINGTALPSSFSFSFTTVKGATGGDGAPGAFLASPAGLALVVGLVAAIAVAVALLAMKRKRKRQAPAPSPGWGEQGAGNWQQAQWQYEQPQGDQYPQQPTWNPP